MRTIWKFPFAPEIAMPRGAQILSAQCQDDCLSLWAECDPEAQRETRKFKLFGTGHEMSSEFLSHVSTVQQGPFVWHLYEVKGE